MSETKDTGPAFTQYRVKTSEDEMESHSNQSETDSLTLGLEGMTLMTPKGPEVPSTTSLSANTAAQTGSLEASNDAFNVLFALIKELKEEIQSNREEIKVNGKEIKEEIKEIKINNEQMQTDIVKLSEILSLEVSRMNRSMSELETRSERKIGEAAKKVEEAVLQEVGIIKMRTDALEESTRKVENMVTTQEGERIICQEKLKFLESEVIAMKGNGITTQVNSVPAHSLARPIFSALANEHPIAFINEVRDYFSVINVPSGMQPQIFFQMLQGEAKTWGKSLLPIPTTLAECIEKFLSNFWDADTQFNFRMQVINGKFIRTKANTMKQFATEKVALARLCSPPMGEGEILYSLIRQFPVPVQNMLKTIEQLTVDRLIVLLGSYDQTYQSNSFFVREKNEFFKEGAM